MYLRFGDRLLGVLVVEHAVGGRDHVPRANQRLVLRSRDQNQPIRDQNGHVPGGHQGTATELAASGVHQSHHPGIFVFLQTESY